MTILGGAGIVKNHTLSNIISHHFRPIEFINKLDNIEAEVFHDEFALFLSKIDEFLDTEAPGNFFFGTSDVYDATKQTGHT